MSSEVAAAVWKRSFGDRALGLVAALSCALFACGPAETPCTTPGFSCRLAGTGQLAFNGDGHKAKETDFYYLSAIKKDPSGRLLMMDSNNWRLRTIDKNGLVQTVMGSGEHLVATPGKPVLETPLENPYDFAFDAEGRLTFVSLHDPRLLRWGSDDRIEVLAGDTTTGDSGDGGKATDARFQVLTSLAFAPDGSIYLSDMEANRIRVIRPDGTIAAFAGTGVAGHTGDGGPATEAQLSKPMQLALSDSGDLYIAESGSHVIRRVKPDGTIDTVVGTGERGSAGDEGKATLATLFAPKGLALDSDGTLYIADTGNNRIRMVSPDGTLHALAGTGQKGLAGDDGPMANAQFSGPASLTIDGRSLYVADYSNGCARTLLLP